MPDYTNPNLKIPTTLWGEVKVAAFRRGVRPVEVVIECLREKFTEPVREAGKVAKVKPEVVAPVKTPPATVSTPTKASLEGYGTCSQCGATGVKTALNKQMKQVCYPCAGV
jgi:hypothetical protein